MKSIFFVDGFNLYHAIDKYFDHNTYKWLNIRKLAEQFIEADEEIKKILFFTAYTIWNTDKIKRHKKYITALSSKGIEIVKGNFKKVEKKFRKDKMKVIESSVSDSELPDELVFQTYEEKETDVNIAVKILEYADTELYDRFYIISGDSDFIPAIKSAKKNYRKIEFINILPIESSGYSLGQVCDDQLKIEEKHLKSSLLEDEIKIGKLIIKKPSKWV